MTGSFGEKLKLGKLKLGNPDFCFLMFYLPISAFPADGGGILRPATNH